jgi:hypothetical protein
MYLDAPTDCDEAKDVISIDWMATLGKGVFYSTKNCPLLT